MTEPILRVDKLRAHLDSPEGPVRAVDGVDLEIRPGETLALLGESGCGKSMTALAIVRLLPFPAGRYTGGHVWLGDIDLLTLPEAAMRRVRGRRIGMIFQEPMSSLNPVLTVGQQIGEVLSGHLGLRARKARERGLALLDEVGMPDAANRWQAYPHQLSGGLKQRVTIAIALAGNPDVLIADEPTTALDVTIQAQILELLARLQRERGMAMLLITHDLAVVGRTADRVAVMYAGTLVETAPSAELFEYPRHPYTRKLFLSLPATAKRGADLSVIRGSVPSLAAKLPACRFADRCDFAWDTCRETVPEWHRDRRAAVLCHLYNRGDSGHAQPTGFPVAKGESTGVADTRADADALLDARDVTVHFPIVKGLLKRTIGHVYAVDGVDLRLQPGKTLALVGESGCGKTTLGLAIAQLQTPTRGSVAFEDEELTRLSGRALRSRRRRLQMIFQDPFSSMDPRMLVADIVAEGLIVQRIGGDNAARRARVADLLEQVGLPAAAMERYPHEFSGGQRQRICIARALALEAKLLICDEPTSALDVSVQAQVLNLLARLQRELDLAYLFITHNMAVVSYLAHEVAVMYLGRIVERGSADEVLNHPKHPYTRALLAATPELNNAREIIRLDGDLPSPANPPAGCHFHPRCPQVMGRCRQDYPATTAFSRSHSAACFLHGDEVRKA